jgi:quinol monooxygenase YgiN
VVIVLGTLQGTRESIDELLRHSLDHVHRSRLEDGCISHGVHVDAEDPLRLVFVEQWADRAALEVHFRQPGSATFLAAIKGLTTSPGTLDVYEVADPA